LKNSTSLLLFVFIASIIAYLAYADLINPKPAELTEVVVKYGVPELTIPDTVYFAGERVPIEIPDVRERLDRELHVNTFWHSNTIFLLKRGHRWLPQIEEILEDNQIPLDLAYLSVIESDLQNKTSPANAVGYWQLLKGTARELGLEVTNEVDERYHPLRSTEAAAKYLSKAREKFGSWANAAASYNIGNRGLERALTRQGVSSYYDLLLGEETSRYLFRAIAIKLIFENPKAYGFIISEDNLYKKEKLKDVKIKKSIPNLRDWAFEKEINYKILKRHNPWLRKNTLTVRSGKTYNVQIPKNRHADKIETGQVIILHNTDSIDEIDIREAPKDTDEEM
jgi:membrane-bound lytic murein transglycosylase D